MNTLQYYYFSLHLGIVFFSFLLRFYFWSDVKNMAGYDFPCLYSLSTIIIWHPSVNETAFVRTVVFQHSVPRDPPTHALGSSYTDLGPGCGACSGS